MLYKFRCKEHGGFELMQPMMAEHMADCPTCGQPARRVFGPYTGHFNVNKPIFALFDEKGNYEECPDPSSSYFNKENLNREAKRRRKVKQEEKQIKAEKILGGA